VEPEVGDRVDGKYALKRLIARGGMGLVFEARHAYTGRAVAVKLIVEGDAYSARCARLSREAVALARVQHPNVVEVLDAGHSEDHGPYLVMEFLQGRPLDGILAARGKLEVLDAVHVGRQLCDAVACAHACAIVHRDIKPSNVIVARDALGQELVKLLDFGVAGGEAALTPASGKVTQKNELLGTAAYMAPEQLMGGQADVRADVYGIAATIFETIAGAPPFGGTFPEVLVKVDASVRPPSLRALRPDAPEALCAVIERALAKDPAARTPDARTLASGLTRALRLPDEFGMHPSKGAERRLALLEGALPAPAPASAASMPQSTQRRRFRRGPYVTTLLVVAPDGQPIEGRTEDISEGGLLANINGTCTAGERVRIRFALPRSGQLIAVDGIVRWARPARNGMLLGIEFADLSDDARALVAASVAAWQGES
jgi:eukaryotic-like serine/threonine-protein kinase